MSKIQVVELIATYNNIDVEKLIPLVEARPVIWDNTLTIYKEKLLRNKAWKEIYAILKDDYGEMDRLQRIEFGKTVLKKWTHIRDSWIKDYRRHMQEKKLGTVLKCKPYKYRHKMSFLKKIIKEDNKLEENEEDEENNKSEEEGYTREWIEDTSSIKIENEGIQFIDNAKEITDVVEMETSNTAYEKQNTIEEAVKYMESKKNNEDDPHLHFFKSLLPFTAMLDPLEMLNFQASVIKLLQDAIKQKKDTDDFFNARI